MSTESARLLTEKLALSRELSNLKPELEHLRSQTEAHQATLSEKLYLQRQLSTAKLELETEKRATQRTLAKQEQNAEKDAKLEILIEELQRELAQERRDKQQLERDAQKEKATWEGRKGVLEAKLDSFRTKLRTTKEQIRQMEGELQRAKAPATTSRARLVGDIEKHTLNPRKRSANQLDIDATIGTPGLGPPAKRGKRGSTLPGDKSTFSITPFLNRTASVAPDTPPEDNAMNRIEERIEGFPPPAEALHNASHTEQTLLSIPRLKANADNPALTHVTVSEVHTLATAKIGKINTKAHRSRKQPAIPSLENVMEEQNDENEPPKTESSLASPENTEPTSNPIVPFPEEVGELKKRKRKLLGNGPGKTLFDEDDEGETTRGGLKAPLAPPKGPGILAKRLLAAPKGSHRNGQASSAAGFGSFSPLKKDKKAIA